MLVQKQFSGVECDPKTYKKPKFSSIFLKWFFPIKSEHIGFWKHSVRYQRTLMFQAFFFILDCLFAINSNPVLTRWLGILFLISNVCLCVCVFLCLWFCPLVASFWLETDWGGRAMRGLDNDYVILGPMRVLQINMMGRGRSQSETDTATTRLTQPRGPSQWKWQHWCNLNLHDS